MLKLSIYSYIFRHLNSFYLYNSANSILAEISETLYIQIYNRDFSDIEDVTLKTLVDKKILVNESDLYTYYNEEKMKYLASSYDKENLGLTIVPFSGCNFACPYCFEENKRSNMITESVINDLIDFINSHTSAKELSLMWYGGEPLMGFKKIKDIYNRIKNETSLEIKSHSIVTNGYLLNKEIIDFFKESNLKSMQITLDGNRESHNKTRFLKSNGGQTFDRILKNIKTTVENLPNCNISIRVNINKNNEDDFFEMYSWLNNEFNYPNISIYPGFIREETKDCNSLCYSSITPGERYNLYAKIKEMGGNVNFFPRIVPKGCMINKLNSYIVGPSGEIYKCWNDFSNEKKIIGYINQDAIQNPSLLTRYMNNTPVFDNPECKDCLQFPICSGGCGWYKYKNQFENGKFSICSQYKDKRNLEMVLINSLTKNDSKLKKIYL